MKGMEQLELHGGQLARVNILAAKGVTSRLGARPGGFAVLNMCGEDHCAYQYTRHTAL